MGSCADRCHQLYMAVVPDDVDSDEDAQLRRSRDRGTFCLAILSFVVALISLIATVMPASKENVCDAYLTSLAKDMMLPYHYEFPKNYVSRTGPVDGAGRAGRAQPRRRAARSAS